jgi:predicted nucleic acid-binding protein
MDRQDASHGRAVAALTSDSGPIVLPVGILAEAAYLIEREFGVHVLDVFLQDIAEGRYLLHCGESDFARIRQLVRRYADLPLGFADSAVIACAERHGGKVLTLDLRHFGVVAHEGTIMVLP